MERMEKITAVGVMVLFSDIYNDFVNFLSTVRIHTDESDI